MPVCSRSPLSPGGVQLRRGTGGFHHHRGLGFTSLIWMGAEVALVGLVGLIGPSRNGQPTRKLVR
ncbi:hypothetical protein SZ00_06124 (plasmid) [Rhodococcus sp. AD45]|nr:hypothetical protein SZ00_06124 [Rhodococcus sp. AD45]